jgi:hypothetical protein
MAEFRIKEFIGTDRTIKYKIQEKKTILYFPYWSDCFNYGLTDGHNESIIYFDYRKQAEHFLKLMQIGEFV